MVKKEIIFLGYNSKQTKLIKFLKTKKITVKSLGQKQISKNNLNKNTILVISFGYRNLIKKEILDFSKNIEFINLHMSYLPFNRGAHPNFWSFYENTQKGISIHLINNKIDQGKLILRKKIYFKNIKKHSFKTTYDILFKKLENLFIKNFSKIISKKYRIIKTQSKGSFHRKNELPKTLVNWDTNILEFSKKN